MTPTTKLNVRSLKSLVGVHPALVKVVMHAAEISELDFVVTEGVRTAARQLELKLAGATRVLKSRHLTGHAVDLAAVVDGEIRWDWPLYPRLSAAMKQAAQDLDVPIVWGGDWPTFKDGPHFELDRKYYPD